MRSSASLLVFNLIGSLAFLLHGAEPPALVATSAISLEAETGRVLFAKNVDEKRSVASTQKLLTALLVAEAGNLEKNITVERSDGEIEPRNLWITHGSRYLKGKLLEMMLMRSFNDVARCLARDHSGSHEKFITAMNAKAKELGMGHSIFKNCHGLDAAGQHSTARDMATLALAAWYDSHIRRIVGIRESTHTYHGANTIDIVNSNELLLSYPECVGMKTGYTAEAGRCLIGAAHRSGRVVLAVVLGSTEEAIWDDSEKLLRWSLDQPRVEPFDLSPFAEESQKKWEKDIKKLEALDQSENHPAESILFLGSSSIKLWEHIEEDMAPYHPIQRGFGGSKFSDLAVFADRLIRPHQFQAVVLFVGNDIKGDSDDKSPEDVARLFAYIRAKIEEHNPEAQVFCLAITPTRQRESVWEKQRAANEAIRSYCQNTKHTWFIGTESIFLDSSGQAKKNYFKEDQLHLNESGYQVWTAAIKSHLDSVLGSGKKTH